MKYQITTEDWFDDLKKRLQSTSPSQSIKPVPQAKSTVQYELADDSDTENQKCADVAQMYFPCLTIEHGKRTNDATVSRFTGPTFTTPQFELEVSRLTLMGQVNLKDLKYNPYLPKSGLIQFYIDIDGGDCEKIIYISEKDFDKMYEIESRSDEDGVAMVFSKMDKPAKRLSLDGVTQYFGNKFDNMFGPPVSYQKGISELSKPQKDFPDIITLTGYYVSINYAMRKGAIKGTNSQMLGYRDTYAYMACD